jgi:tRNA pseudouridine38-40 synthase
MRNIQLTLAYDGSRYVGWQVQSNGLAIQAVIEKAIERLTGTHSPVYSAGRTDSGVHALGQVANFHTASPIPPERWTAALRQYLPPDIVLLASRQVPDSFHSTFSAIRKRYRYVIHNGRTPLPFLRNYTHHVYRRLDSDAMHAAAQRLLGKHDFRSFETEWPNKATSVRTVMEIGIVRRPVWRVWQTTPPDFSAISAPSPEIPGMGGNHPPPVSSNLTDDVREGDFLCLDIVADGFLYNMVRSIMGTLIDVGRGRWSADDITRILTAQTRSAAGNTAPACGLYLVQVDYDPV